MSSWLYEKNNFSIQDRSQEKLFYDRFLRPPILSNHVWTKEKFGPLSIARKIKMHWLIVFKIYHLSGDSRTVSFRIHRTVDLKTFWHFNFIHNSLLWTWSETYWKYTVKTRLIIEWRLFKKRFLCCQQPCWYHCLMKYVARLNFFENYPTSLQN